MRPQVVQDRVAIAYELPHNIRERLHSETGFPADGFEELQSWLVQANLVRPFEDTPTPGRRYAVFKRAKRQVELFLRSGSGSEALRQTVAMLQVGFFGDIFRQSDYDFDGLLEYLEGSETDTGELHLLHFVDILNEAIDAIVTKRPGQGRPMRLTLHASIGRLRAMFRTRCAPAPHLRSHQGFLEVLSPYEEREMAFVAIVFSQCGPVPGAYYASDNGLDLEKAWRKALLRLFLKASCQPDWTNVGRSKWRPGDPSHWPTSDYQ
jgi:hypothetical protein